MMANLLQLIYLSYSMDEQLRQRHKRHVVLGNLC